MGFRLAGMLFGIGFLLVFGVVLDDVVTGGPPPTYALPYASLVAVGALLIFVGAPLALLVRRKQGDDERPNVLRGDGSRRSRTRGPRVHRF